ncbi:MAG: hypothetical protein WB510_13340 [Candidatus Sulfotelmatobacter sp.]
MSGMARARRLVGVPTVVLVALLGIASPAAASGPSQTVPQAPSSSSSKHKGKAATGADSPSSDESVSNGVYRNVALGFSCKIPPGWVLRTDDLNTTDNADPAETTKDTKPASGHVLLAAFSRPPEARGEDVNSSILIAAESVSAYPGLKEAVQYFGPLTEVAKAQGFTVDQEPYEIAFGTKTLVRGDFHKDVGTRVMRQATLVMLARGYAVSFTFIGGTGDEVEELVAGLSFGGTASHN